MLTFGGLGGANDFGLPNPDAAAAAEPLDKLSKRSRC